MTIQVNKLNDLYLIKNYLTQDGLWETLYDSAYKEKKDWVPLSSADYIACQDEDGRIICLYMFVPKTTLTVEAHMYLHPKFWGKDASSSALLAGIDYLKNNTKFEKIVTNTPETCTHVCNFLERNDFKQEGYSPDSLIWKGIKTGQIYFGRSIYERGISYGKWRRSNISSRTKFGSRASSRCSSKRFC